MKINLNIIKILVIFSLVISGLNAKYTWILDICNLAGCPGCTATLRPKVKSASKSIDKKHKKLEKNIAKKYKKDILNANIKKIHKIQVGITKSVARINAMEQKANMDSKKLIFLLRKNKDLYSLPPGSK